MEEVVSDYLTKLGISYIYFRYFTYFSQFSVNIFVLLHLQLYRNIFSSFKLLDVNNFYVKDMVNLFDFFV